MGFRSTLITEDIGLSLPEWFVDKYRDYFWMCDEEGKFYFPISTKFEIKTYFPTGEELPKDLQRVLNEQEGGCNNDLVFIWLHECGGITRVEIHKDKIIYTEPVGWKKVDGITHDYCYGCSDAENIK